jgi:hypothetical protein
MSTDMIARLFKFKKQLVYGDVTLYMRIPGDQKVDDIRNESLLASRRLRKALRNPESDEYLLHIDIVEDISDDDLKIACVNLAMRDIMRDYLNNNPRPILPSLGDNPSQEEQENLIAARAQREIDYADSMRAYVEDWRTRYMSGLDKATSDQLKNVYKRLKVDRVCEEEFSSYFEDRIISASVYTDADYAVEAFTIEEFKGLPTEFKTFLREEFTSLNVSGDDLKK